MSVSSTEFFHALRQTELGCDLLAFLAAREITVVLLPPPSVPGMHVVAAYKAAEKKIYIDPDLSLPEMLHFFAHETRHVAQVDSDKNAGPRRDFNRAADPTNACFNVRLKEIDAEVFAVYFVRNHDRQSGTAHFAALSVPGQESGRAVDRSFLYRAFAAASARYGGADMSAALRAGMLGAAAALIEERATLRAYDQLTLRTWRKNVPPVLLRAAQSETHSQHRAMQDCSASPLDRRALAGFYAGGYAALFQDAGVPNYLADTAPENFVDYIDRGIQGDRRPLRRAQARFQGLCENPCRKV